MCQPVVMPHVPDPFALLSTSQRLALGLVRESWSRLQSLTVTGVTQPEEALRELGALVSSITDLAGATAQPLQDFITRQRELADTLANLADAQADLSRLVAALAQRHAEAVEALEHLSAPALGLMGVRPAPSDTTRGTRKRP
jgi:hypothetical protein